MATIKYGPTNIESLDSLVEQSFNLKSPFRSTVPLLAYWSDPEARLAQLSDALDIRLAPDASLIFEERVRPPKGRGKASCTDLMIKAAAVTLGKEAKYTEGPYATVSRWLGAPATRNRSLVLAGWLETISQATGNRITAEQVQTVTYQLIHRTASVCASRAAQRAVIYHCFDPVARHRTYYRAQLQALATLTVAPDKLEFYLVETVLSKTPAFAQLQARWLARKQDLSKEVRDLLKARSVATFSAPVAVRISAAPI